MYLSVFSTQVFLRPLPPSRPLGLDFPQSCGEVVGRPAVEDGGGVATGLGAVPGLVTRWLGSCFWTWSTLRTVKPAHSGNQLSVSSTSQSRKQEEALGQPPLAGTDKPQLSPICSEGPSSPGRSGDEDCGTGALPPGHGPSPPEQACPRSPEEDDSFKYVREIFFS